MRTPIHAAMRYMRGTQGICCTLLSHHAREAGAPDEGAPFHDAARRGQLQGTGTICARMRAGWTPRPPARHPVAATSFALSVSAGLLLQEHVGCSS